jgi:branched-chain amino acid aminotransferase
MGAELFELVRDEVIHRGTFGSVAEATTGLPEGSYTTLRTYFGHRVFRLADHARRLTESIGLLGRSVSLPPARLRAAFAGALRASRHPESRLRIVFAPPRLFVAVERFQPLPEAVYERGIACVTTAVHRENPHSKDSRFIASASATYRSLPEAVHEALMVGPDGSLLEGLSSNFFAVHQGVLRSEGERALLGLTRVVVIEAAEGLVPFSASAVRISELGEVTECFLSSASREVLPAIRIDERTIGDGRPGPITRELRRRVRAVIDREAASVLERD